GFTTSIDVIPNGVLKPKEEDRIKRSEAAQKLGIHLNEHEKVLLYLGRIHPKKGLHLLLPAFASFRVSHPEWKLLVAGSFYNSTFQSEVEALSALAGDQGVFFVGEVEGNIKTACLSIADCFVLPSLSEGFPNAVVEALSWGIPALVTPGCNFPSIVEYGAGLEVPAEENALREGLCQILEKNTLATMSVKARLLVRDRYQLEHVVTQFEELASQ
ncbi:MAG: glycosyltransferase, partial [Prosthecobacter sp.]|nr:glycosyltransferase [Prosthecobacter sp.]